MTLLAKRRAQAFHLAAITVALFALQIGCTKAGGNMPGHGIEVQREVLIPKLPGTPRALAMLGNGGFVVAGIFGTAWAAATDLNGKLLWRYEEPYDSAFPKNKAEFHDVVVLANGQILLCGVIYTKDQAPGLIVLLDANGHLVERRLLFPGGEKANFGSLDRIISWGDGYAATGWGTDQKKSFYWLVKLDKAGATEWDKIRGELAGIPTVTLHDQSLVQVGHADEEGLSVVRLNSEGKVIVRRRIDALEGKPSQRYGSAQGVTIVALDSQFRSEVLTLGDDLQNLKAGKIIGAPNIHDGCAFDLPDGSVALFGSRLVNGGENRSTIGWAGPQDQIREIPVPTGISSLSFRAAVRIAPTTFVAIRDQVSGPDRPNETGVVLSWIAFN